MCLASGRPCQITQPVSQLLAQSPSASRGSVAIDRGLVLGRLYIAASLTTSVWEHTKGRRIANATGGKVGFELATNGIQFQVFANSPKDNWSQQERMLQVCWQSLCPLFGVLGSALQCYYTWCNLWTGNI